MMIIHQTFEHIQVKISNFHSFIQHTHTKTTTDHKLATGVLHKLQSLVSVVGRGHIAGHEGHACRHERQVASWHLTIVHGLHTRLTYEIRVLQ